MRLHVPVLSFFLGYGHKEGILAAWTGFVMFTSWLMTSGCVIFSTFLNLSVLQLPSL